MRFAGGTAIHRKGYIHIKSGPLRDVLVHRLVAAAYIGRELRIDEEVHHADGNKLNPHWNNLIILGNKDHSWVSAKQHWFMKNKEAKEKAEWDAYMAEKHAEFTDEVTEAKMNNEPWFPRVEDGHMEEEWKQRTAQS